MIFKIQQMVQTIFFQFTEQLNIQTVKAKSFLSLKTRFLIKILTFNLCFFVNEMFSETDDIAKIKGL